MRFSRHVFGDFDFEKDAANLLKEQESWGKEEGEDDAPLASRGVGNGSA